MYCTYVCTHCRPCICLHCAAKCDQLSENRRARKPRRGAQTKKILRTRVHKAIFTLMIQVKTMCFKAKSPGLSGGGLVEANLRVVIEAIVAQAAEGHTEAQSDQRQNESSEQDKSKLARAVLCCTTYSSFARTLLTLRFLA